MLPDDLETVIVQAVAAGVACCAEDLEAGQRQALEVPSKIRNRCFHKII